MMNTVRGHFNGTNIVLDENIDLTNGQVVFITALEEHVKKDKKSINLRDYIGHTKEHVFDRDAAEVIREDRNNDRF